MYYLVSIYKEEDFELLRNYDIKKNKSNRIVIEIKNDIVFTKDITPYNLDGFDVLIKGNNHTLSNLNIYGNNFVGLIRKVDNIQVIDLNLSHVNIYGNVKCASIAAQVNENASIDNSNFDDIFVNCDAFAGGIIGRCKNISISNSNIKAYVYAHDIAGGVVGLTDEYYQENCNLVINGITIGKAISDNAGYAELKKIK